MQLEAAPPRTLTLPRLALSHRAVVLAATVFAGVVAFGVYLTTLAPTIMWYDMGEFATAASTLGIAHNTGYPLLISEMTVLTALRTAATSALMATFLARRDSKVMALIGAGAQSEFQALAFKALLGIEELRVFDVDPAAVEKFIANVGTGHGLRITRSRSVAEAVRGADIVTTATADKTRATILTPQMIEPGMHLNAIGGDCPGKTELHRDIVAGAKVFVEYAPQTRIEGEIQQLAPDFPVTELWQVLSGAQPGRRSASEVTLFDSVGFAIEDFSALRYVRDLTARRKSEIDLVPQMEDPKDLFPLVAAGGRPPPRRGPPPPGGGGGRRRAGGGGRPPRLQWRRGPRQAVVRPPRPRTGASGCPVPQASRRAARRGRVAPRTPVHPPGHRTQ